MLPEQSEISAHHTGAGGSLSGLVIGDAVVLETVCPPLVATLTAAGLRTPLDMGSRQRLAALAGVEFVENSLHSKPLGVFPVAGLSRPDDAGRQVCDASTVLVLVPMLATCARARVPFEPEVAGVAPVERGVVSDLGRVEHGNDNCAGVDAPALLSRRDALDAVAAGLVIEGGNVAPFNRELGLALGLGQSRQRPTGTGAQARIGGGEIGHEQGGIFPAFGLVDFESALHVALLPRFGRVVH